MNICLRRLCLIAACLLAGSSTIAGEAEVRIVTLGDSITRGVRPGVKAEETFAALLQDGLLKKKINAEVINVGIGGERTDQALRRLASAVISLKPSIVTIMYGTNDCYIYKGKKAPEVSIQKYEENLHSLVRDLRKAGITPILMSPTRWGDKARNGAGDNPNPGLEEYVKICRKAATETKSPLVDHFAHWSKQTAKGIDITQWTTDACHPNPRGHREIAELILPVVLKALAK